MIKLKFLVMNKEWTLRLLKKKQFKKKNGSGLGATKGWKRVIDLHPGGFDLETINHELAHAYRAEMCVDSMTDQTPADVEEFYAELISKRGRELLDLGDDLFKRVKALTQPKLTEDIS